MGDMPSASLTLVELGLHPNSDLCACEDSDACFGFADR